MFNENVMVLAAFVAFFSLAFVLPTVRVWRQTGRNPYVLPAGDDAYGFVSRCMKLLIAGLLAYCAGQLIWPGFAARISLVAPDAMTPLRTGGWVLMGCAIAWTVASQYQMGQSWRIGIDHAHKTALVTRGLFALSRNPIFLAMRACLAALVLIQPNTITLALYLIGDLVMQFQVRLEEAFLAAQHADAYAAYRKKVRRWL